MTELEKTFDIIDKAIAKAKVLINPKKYQGKFQDEVELNGVYLYVCYDFYETASINHVYCDDQDIYQLLSNDQLLKIGDMLFEIQKNNNEPCDDAEYDASKY